MLHMEPVYDYNGYRNGYRNRFPSYLDYRGRYIKSYFFDRMFFPFLIVLSLSMILQTSIPFSMATNAPSLPLACLLVIMVYKFSMGQACLVQA